MKRLELEPTSWGRRLTFNKPWRLAFRGSALVIDPGGGVPARSHPAWTVNSIHADTGLRWAAVHIGLVDNVVVSLDGALNAEAATFAKAVNEALDSQFLQQLGAWKPLLGSERARIQRGLPTQRWISRRDAAALIAATTPPAELPPLAALKANPRFARLSSQVLHPVDLETAMWLTDGIAPLIEQRNDAFTAAEIEAQAAFFRGIESQPLTREQCEAVICGDERQLIVAAAGSGKTSTLIAKAGYAVHRRLAAPGEILLLAFNRDAAREMQRRIDQRLAPAIADAGAITALTMHAFGGRVIGEATGKAPSIAHWLDSTSRELEFVEGLLLACRKDDKAFARELSLFYTIYPRDLGPPDRDPEDYDPETRRAGFRTRAGEIVRSPDEQWIADWLFFHQVPYEYERPYSVDTADALHRQYAPDFFYPDADLWHEHLAIKSDGTSAYGYRYLQKMEWARKVHAEHHTRLFETTSAELRGFGPFKRLEARLKESGLQVVFDPERKSEVTAPLSPTRLAGLLRTFMQHAKGNRLSTDAMRDRIFARSDAISAQRQALFLSIYTRVAHAWEEALRAAQCVDFEDLILQAADLIAAGRWTNPYRLILADEFQDTSRARASLLKAAVESREDTTFVAVGDDWQSINRFAGADVSVMTQFESTFGVSTRRYLTETFRFSQRMADLSGEFIQRNPAQIKKTVRARAEKGPAVHPLVVRHADDFAGALQRSLQQLARKVSSGSVRRPLDRKVSVMLLGRYNDDMPAQFASWTQLFASDLDLTFMTVHGSKGLEADYVYVLGLVPGRRGFPSQIDDDPVLRMVLPLSEPYEHAEERRLFYVALTRARRLAILCSVHEWYSPFLLEVVAESSIAVQDGDGTSGVEQLEVCTSCRKGVMVARTGRRGPFRGCSRFPACRATLDGPSGAGEQTRPRGAPSKAMHPRRHW